MTIETPNTQEILTQLENEGVFFMEYMKEIVEQLIEGKIGLRTFEEAYCISYDEAKKDSQAIDESYARGDLGRFAIVEGGPDYISSFEANKIRCLEILREKGVPLFIS